VKTDNTLCMLPAASTWLLLINSRLVYNRLYHGSFPHSSCRQSKICQLSVSHTRLPASNEASDALSGWVRSNSPTIVDFKHDLRAALDNRFAFSMANTTSHPFVTATVTKRWELFWWSVNNRLSRDDDRLWKKTSLTSLRKSAHTKC